MSAIGPQIHEFINKLGENRVKLSTSITSRTFQPEFEFNNFTCYLCNGYYGPSFGEPVCVTCHEFLYPDIPHHLPNSYIFSEKTDDGDSGNDEPSVGELLYNDRRLTRALQQQGVPNWAFRFQNSLDSEASPDDPIDLSSRPRCLIDTLGLSRGPSNSSSVGSSNNCSPDGGPSVGPSGSRPNYGVPNGEPNGATSSGSNIGPNGGPHGEPNGGPDYGGPSVGPIGVLSVGPISGGPNGVPNSVPNVGPRCRHNGGPNISGSNIGPNYEGPYGGPNDCSDYSGPYGRPNGGPNISGPNGGPNYGGPYGGPNGGPYGEPNIGGPNGVPNIGRPNGGPEYGGPYGEHNIGGPNGEPNMGEPNMGGPIGEPNIGGPNGGPNIGGPNDGPNGGPNIGGLNVGPNYGDPYGGPNNGGHNGGPDYGDPYGGPDYGEPYGGPNNGVPNDGPDDGEPNVELNGGPNHGRPYVGPYVRPYVRPYGGAYYGVPNGAGPSHDDGLGPAVPDDGQHRPLPSCLARSLAALSTPRPSDNLAPGLVEQLPSEVLLCIFSYLDDLSLCACALVCTRWLRLVRARVTQPRWAVFTSRRWPLFLPMFNIQDWHKKYQSLVQSCFCRNCVVQMCMQSQPPFEENAWRRNRLRNEIKMLRNTPPEGCAATPLDPKCCHWQAMVMGPVGSPYEGGVFYLYIQVPYSYPMSPPVVRFLTRILHPNVSRHGDVGIDSVHHNWSLALTISKLLISIQSLLTDPYTAVCMEPEVGEMYMNDRVRFERIARRWTWHYAMHDLCCINS